MKKLVLFVCSGNTCRSPMAEYLLKVAMGSSELAERYDICSAGISAQKNMTSSVLAKQVMQDIAPNIDQHISQPITQSLLDSASVIFCLTNHHKMFLLSQYKNIKEKCFLVREFCDKTDIHDPFYGEIEDYVRTRNQISEAIDSILKFLRMQ